MQNSQEIQLKKFTQQIYSLNERDKSCNARSKVEYFHSTFDYKTKKEQKRSKKCFNIHLFKLDPIHPF